ncbi:MAG: hypothetical protein ACI4KM_09415 [Oscillospiraceae bacterium]
MRKILAAAAALLIMTLCACASGEISAKYSDNTLTVPAASIKLDIPEGWTVSTGDKVYEGIIRDSGGVFADSAELKKSAKEQGISYIAYAQSPDSSVIMTISVHDMKAAEHTEGYTYLDGRDYAQSVHDGIIFDYQMEGCSTRGTGEFIEDNFGGLDGWLSHFEMYQPTDGADVYVLGQYELMTQHNDFMYMIQLCYAQGFEETAREVVYSAGRT